jgi:hypothetical protein
MRPRIFGVPVRITVALLVLGACGKMEPPRAPSSETRMAELKEEVARGGHAGKPRRAMAKKDSGPSKGLLDALGGGGGAAANAFALAAGAPGAPPPPAPAAEAAAPDADESGEGGGGQTAATRAWFPETFLFNPLVVTDAEGLASVAVKVPDRLTTWHVLALAHDRSGAQAGAVGRFLGTLPTYVDPVVPSFLIAGDSVRLPIQVVNTTEQTASASLKLEVSGAVLMRGGGALQIPAEGSRVEYAELRAERAGDVSLKASLGAQDAVLRTFPVFPVGRPVALDRGGSLAAARTLEIEAPKDLGRDGAKVRLAVFPGALALLRSELASASMREGPASDAYALLLAGRGGALLRSLGDEPDDKALRALGIIAGQRAIRDARAPDVATASLLLEPALSHPDNPVLSRLGARLAERVASAQRPDGTFEGGTGWTLQRLLAMTAMAIGAVRADSSSPRAKQRATGASLRTEAAIERNLERIEDGYTAAAILASGVVKGAVAERLQAVVLKAVKDRGDGTRVVPVESGLVRADGSAPSELEATALAVLALSGGAKVSKDAAQVLPDLGAALLAGYRPGYGWGDGATNLVALRAVLALFKDPLPDRIKVALELDGRPVVEGVLEGRARRELLALDAEQGSTPFAGKHRWTVRADPPVAGLGFSLTLKGFVPWSEEPSAAGLELSVKMPAKELKLGAPADITLSAIAPSGVDLKLRHAIPSGVQVERATLDALVASGAIRAYETEDGTVSLTIPARQPGQSFSASYRVIPTLAGTLHASASTLAPVNDPNTAFHLPPAVWLVR